MILYLIAILIICFFVFFNYNVEKNYGYPPFLYSVVWLIVIALHGISCFLKIIDIYKLSLSALSIFTLGVMVFSFAGLIAKKKLNIYKIDSFKKKSENVHFVFNKKIEIGLLLISVAFFPLLVYQSYLLAQEYMIFDSLFAGLRNAYIQGQDVGASKYGIIFAYVSFYVQTIKYIETKKNLKMFILSLVILLLYCILSTGRTFFLIFICLILGILIYKGKLKKKYLLYFGISFFALFFLVGIFLKKGADSDNSFGENISGISTSFLQYYLGGVSAFDQFLNSKFQYAYGEQSLRFFYNILASLGLVENKEIVLTQEYVSIPFEFNVYTIYKTYVQDFGIWYIVLILGLMSYIHTYCYYKAIKDSNFLYSFLYALLLYPLVMSSFQEQYLTLAPTWIYLTALIMFVYKFSFKKVSV